MSQIQNGFIRPDYQVAVDNTRVAARPAPECLDLQSKQSVVQDKAVLTSKNNLPTDYEGVAKSATSVTVDGWKKGKNDCLEHILKNQGYSLSEIYKKDESGKSLIDRVAATNSLKDPNVLRPGQELIIPSNLESGKNEAASSKGKAPGTSESIQAGENNQNQVTVKNGVTRDGVHYSKTKTDHSVANSDARVRTRLEAGVDGRVDSNVRSNGDGTTTAENVATSQSGTSVTQETITNAGNQVEVEYKDLDRVKNANARYEDGVLTFDNPDSDGSEGTRAEAKVGEQYSDGLFERSLGRLGDWALGRERSEPSLSMDNVASVKVDKSSDGAATITAKNANGELETVKTAGDSDDTLIEQAGEAIDDTFRAAGKGLESAWSWLRGG